LHVSKAHALLASTEALKENKMERGLPALYAVLAVLIFTVPGLAAEPYPTKPVHLVVGFAAGGPTDIPARFIADRLGEMLGHRVIVENKPGAAGMIATRDVLAQPADGHTLLLCTHFESINLAVYTDPGFKLADIAPISLVSKCYYAIALSSAVPVARLGEFHAVAAMPEYRKLIESGGSMPEGSTPSELQQVLRQTVDDISGTVRRYGLQ
jgi:tripartite-type tricarboxylate transporter receptor subunit TctC